MIVVMDNITLEEIRIEGFVLLNKVHNNLILVYDDLVLVSGISRMEDIDEVVVMVFVILEVDFENSDMVHVIVRN